jgi:hypothetical protein
MKLTIDALKKIVGSVVGTKPNEMNCDECFERLDLFVDLKFQGKDAAEVMPLIHDHLNRCSACREEFEALLDCIKATTK